ncbi:efflux RND transporter periplasmic adaptor subunit [Dechloromonas sp. TW-R-39-2]|uniref:efflux RND transporter periplasmic adaptor subunit n=1 Tax=Dechloromonas sp. TW-R-39-2 TaxID=2654218 RepID=UPI00193EAD38|nr:efflux RND transporter periplasmic adaptor subunit [Dechloromonas sp. TW-R-39-2]QRM19271.1 efflux RND transporter periplasmic adaptor subunit [Dechloromonas sp. TW-R-39-2]
MPAFRILLPLLLSLLSPASGASEGMTLNALQIKSLGLESVLAGQDSGTGGGTLPARVMVPNSQMRVITAPVGGMIEMLAVAPGETVRRGQVVAHLASPQALELQRDALQSGSQSALLQQNLKRDEQLFAEGLIAEARLQATRSAASQAAAQASERRQGLALAGVTPGKLGGPLALTAAIDGVVLEQGVQLGQRVDSAALIYRIARLSPLWLEIQAPLALAETLRPGTPVKLGGSTLQGKLVAIGRAVDPASQTVLLRAEVSQGADSLRPGQMLEVVIATPNGSLQRLPASALVRHQGKTLVFIQNATNEKGSTFTPRQVRVVSQGGGSFVAEGVAAGERIVSHGVSGLKAMLTGVGAE